MSPKRPISSQRTDLRPANSKSAKQDALDRVRDAKRETGPEHDGDPASAATKDGERVVPDLSHRAGTAGTAASDAVTQAAGRVLGDKDGPKDVFDPSSELDRRAGRAQSERDELRDRARHGVQDDAATGDGTTGIAEQGTDAIAVDTSGRHAGKTLPSSDPADVAESKRLFEAEQARDSDRHVYDPDSDDPRQRVFADEVDTVLPELAPLSDPAPSAAEPAPTGKATSSGNVGSVDDEHQHTLDPGKAQLTGLDDFLDTLHQPAVAGGGNTDPVDDDEFGTGAIIAAPVAAAAAGAAGSALLGGGDTRGVDIGSGGAGNGPVDPGGNAGTIDPGPDADPGFGGGGLEDDPLDNGQSPSLGLDAARGPADDSDDTPDDEVDTGEPSTEAPFHLFGEVSPINDVVFDHVADLDVASNDDEPAD